MIKIDPTRPGDCVTYYKHAIERAARLEHAGDIAGRQAILDGLAQFRIEWAALDLSPIDSNGIWPIGPRRFHARTVDLQAELKRSQDRGPKEAAATEALNRHLELGRSLGYVQA
jgi:hypothetical protein